jgi:hypothetical protein
MHLIPGKEIARGAPQGQPTDNKDGAQKQE